MYTSAVLSGGGQPRDQLGKAPETVPRNLFERSAERFWRLKTSLGQEQSRARISARHDSRTVECYRTGVRRSSARLFSTAGFHPSLQKPPHWRSVNPAFERGSPS